MKKLFIIISLILTTTVFVLCFCGCYHGNELTHTGDIPYTVSYTCTDGGKIEGKSLQRIKRGENSEEVSAIADDGYYFIKWSDGIADVTRKDFDIKSNMDIKAEFAIITDGVNITYDAIGPGYINGDKQQTIQRGTDSRIVEARTYDNSEPGEIFIKWSDGYTNPIRQDNVIAESASFTAEFGYMVNYNIVGNGNIIGSLNQAIVVGEPATAVTAIPDKGFRFVEWSDGVKTSTRHDKYVTKPIDVHAVFEWRDTDSFVYHYNYATGNYCEDAFTLTRGDVEGKTTIVPEREFFIFAGWYLDEEFTQQATDSNGNNILGEEIFNSPSRDLFAKWDVKEEYVAEYNILMVYVAAIDGVFVGNDGQNVNVHYEMSATEKQECIELTKLFKETLNDMLDGLVNFEVDSYFTTKPINEKSFTNEKNNTYIYAHQIPELSDSELMDNYRSVITLYSFGGEEALLVNWAGTGGERYATIPIDNAIKYSGSLKQAFGYYDGIIGTCVHEFIHTIELGITSYEFHRAYVPLASSYISHKLFLMNQYPIDYYTKLSDNSELWKEDYLMEVWRSSDKVGVPYGYWLNEIFDVIIKPECVNGQSDGYGGGGTVDTGGYILPYSPNAEELDWWRAHHSDVAYGQRVPKGSRTTQLFPKAQKGYRFIGWSDGVQDELRVLTNVQNDIILIAYFERLSYTVEYIAGEGGKIKGESIQTLLTGERTVEVLAIAENGYRFIGWSDGRTSAYRSDIIGQNEYDENGELYFRLGFFVTAIFEKIEE
ncbi:MAG: InlB B-repeat-containing protein [Bacilli bacterium]|nr:InlB B-repeat-containing protein [Bacilli bacterium]